MTAPARVDSPVIRRIFEAYKMDESDIVSLYQGIERQLTITYRQVIAQQLNLYGCQRTVTGPDNRSLKWIQSKARQDSESIANTFDRELMSRIQRIRSANRRANRFYFIRELDAWIAGRTPRKSASIGLNTMTSAREYAQTRFAQENNIQGKWVFTGPPPVCKICIRIKGLGPVTFERTQKQRLPAHINCPHRWSQLIPKKIECGPDTWTG